MDKRNEVEKQIAYYVLPNGHVNSGMDLGRALRALIGGVFRLLVALGKLATALITRR